MPSSTKQVLVPIANGTEPMEAAIIIDVLRRAGSAVTVASVEKNLRVEASQGLKFIADELVAHCSNNIYDLIALPGGIPGASNLKNCGVLESMMKKQAANGRLFAAICASPAVVLGSWGLLMGLKATCYPSFMEQLQSFATAVDSRVQQHGKAVTSAGPDTALEFAIVLVEHLFGKEKAVEVSVPLVMRTNHANEFTFEELNSMNWTFDSVPLVLVPIANGTEEMEAIIIVDILRRAKATVVMASVEDSLVIMASCNIKLEADALLDDLLESSFDLIVLPGGLGGAEAFSKSDKLVTMLQRQKKVNKPYGAICASPALVLEPHGFLQGKKATAFPSLCEKLSDMSEIEKRVVIDGNLITSRAPGTAIEFALAIVQKFFGREKALQLAKTLLFLHPQTLLCEGC